jgi:uncharacterized protein (DUF488 family)
MNVVYTIGYEGADIERFLTTLRTAGITQLVDVRATAVSRKKGFSKNGLREQLEAEGISYLHLVELGDPRAGRDAARAGNYAEFRRVYSAHLKTSDAIGALNSLDKAARNDAVCLLCFERNPAACHRAMIANWLKKRDFEVFDLYVDEPSQQVPHPKKISRHHSGQGGAKSQPEVW